MIYVQRSSWCELEGVLQIIIKEDGEFRGLITIKDLSHTIINENDEDLYTSYDNLQEVLKAEEILRFNDEIVGKSLIASYRSTTFLENVKLDKNIPSIFMRRDGFTNGATYEEIIEMSVKSKNTQYDILISDVKYEASNYTELRDFYALHNDGKELPEKALIFSFKYLFNSSIFIFPFAFVLITV